MEIVEAEDYHTIVLLDGIGRIEYGEQQSLFNIPTQDSIDFLIGIDNPHTGEGTKIFIFKVGSSIMLFSFYFLRCMYFHPHWKEFDV